jgi:hypothetical protein
MTRLMPGMIVLIAMAAIAVVLWRFLASESAVDLSSGRDIVWAERRDDGRLAEQIAKLTEEVRGLVRRLDKQVGTGVPASASVVTTDGPVKPELAANPEEAKRLTAAIETLVRSVEKLHSHEVATQATRETARIRCEDPPRDMRALWTNEEEAKKALVIRTYADVARIVGTPNEVFRIDDTVYWEYESGSIRFIDGYVSGVKFYSREDD